MEPSSPIPGRPGSMRRRRVGWLLPWLLLAVLPAHGEPSLPEPVSRVATALGVPLADISVWVQEIGSDAPLLHHHADVPRTPASTMKLVTTFTALQGLTPAYQWRTEAYALGPLHDGVLEGDLLLRGYGDPYMVAEEYWKLIRGIRQQGVWRIDGDVVFDSSYYRLPEESRAAFDGRPDRIYNLVPHPLLVNFNAMRFEFEPAGTEVRVTTRPSLGNVVVDNRLRLHPGACGGFQRGVALNVLEPPTRERVMLEGAFPATCDRYALTRSVLQPETYAWGLFKKYWQQLGGEIRGQWRTGELPPGLRVATDGDGALAEVSANAQADGGLLHVHHSRPLGELVRLANKYSNNVMTRHLELTLGAERFDPPATPEKGRAATLELLRRQGIDTSGLIIDNPSGLSRVARMSARQLAELLLAAWEAPYMPEFVSSMPLAGLDGTMRRRFQDAAETGRMHLKTGTLDHVSAIAGYVQTAGNRRFVVVVLINTPQAHRGPGEEIQDALLRWVFRNS